MGWGLRRLAQWTSFAAFALGFFQCSAASAETPTARIDAALQNITNLTRAGRVGYATIWDGNKYVQCRRTAERRLRCEAAGWIMQPSLKRILTIERLARLAASGWVLDPNFGNFVRTFPPDMPTGRIADQILKVLTEVYDANSAELELQTTWVIDMPCPPRNGPSQNLAGIVNDSPSMRAHAVYDCSYEAKEEPRTVTSVKELIDIYGANTTAEIQRLRVNVSRNIYVVFGAGIGYIQCAPDPSGAVYCEAQSAESWPALTSVLTPERISILHAAGYSDPGRAPNYSKSYSLDQFSDAAIANEILTILYDVYGYRGATTLKVSTE